MGKRLPSPNGSTISAQLADVVPVVLGVSLRSRAAAARRLLAGPGVRVAVVAAGERWPDGSLRPAVEDLWGAGALIAALLDGGRPDPAPEAVAAAAAFTAVADDLPAALHDCASGRELAAIGHAADVDVAAELDRGTEVPILVGEAFVPGSGVSG